MSLGKARTRIKEGVKQIQSLEGAQRVVVNLGIGAAVGAIAQIILTYIMMSFVYPLFQKPEMPPPCIQGFSIFPNQFGFDLEGNKIYYTTFTDIILIIATVAMLVSKKFWIVIGFFIGWYSSTYFGLYEALGLPVQEV